MLSAQPPVFPFVALLVSGGHTQLMRVGGVGDYTLLGESVDDAAGEAFDKTAKLLGLPYPGGPILSRLATQGVAGRFKLPRPMKNTGDLMFSFSGLKTAVLTASQKPDFTPEHVPDLAAEFQEAVVDVLCHKARAALAQTGLSQLVVAGGVGANTRLRERLHTEIERRGGQVFFPELEYCSDNGAMIAFACAMRVKAGQTQASMGGAFAIRPRWPLAELR
jgi:N6-L-threonylcarbamoyladenine synthase